MKVLMVNNLYTPNVRGGAERSVQLLAEALVRAGVEVTVATTDERAGAPVDVNGVRVVTLAIANLYWPFGNAAPSPLRRKLWHLLDVYNPLMSRTTAPQRLRCPLMRATRFALLALGGLAAGLGLSIGGLAIGSVAVGGAAIGFVYAIGGGAFGPAIIDGRRCDPAAVEFVRQWLGSSLLPPNCR